MPMFWKDRSTDKYSEEEVRQIFKPLYDYCEELDAGIKGKLAELWFSWLQAKSVRDRNRRKR